MFQVEGIKVVQPVGQPAILTAFRGTVTHDLSEGRGHQPTVVN